MIGLAERFIVISTMSFRSVDVEPVHYSKRECSSEWSIEHSVSFFKIGNLFAKLVKS